MKKIWNDMQLKRRYIREVEKAKESNYEFTDEELDSPYLDKLSHQTKSNRIMRMVTLAYHLGKLRAIQDIDDGKTPVIMS